MTLTQTARALVISTACVLFTTTATHAQALGDFAAAKPVPGDPGMTFMVVIDDAHVRVLRDYAEPGATRRMHAHADATYHVFTLLTGQLRLTVEGQPPVDVTAGQILTLKAGVNHTFINTSTVIATIVEVFGKAPKTP
ncbi:MAG TPA: cupin domain-containing protein [Vicinamibacterales bacterium]|nr:cupin domain-containing protein [Vicinamibacterales bacterium]